MGDVIKLKRKKNWKKIILISSGVALASISVMAVIKSIMNGDSSDVENAVSDQIYDYQEFWLKDGTNAFIHTIDGKVDTVDFTCQNIETLAEASKELEELAKYMGYSVDQVFDHIQFTNY